MPFELLPAGMDDVPAIVGVFQAAFQGDPIVGRLMCDVEPKIKHDYDVRFFEKYIRDGAMTGSRFAKIVATDTGTLIAFSKWQYPYTLTEQQKKDKDASYTKRVPYPEGTNEDLYKEFFDQLDTLRESHIDDRKDYFLHLLAVSPNYQRQGLGSMLIREGLAAADHDNARSYIEASPAGLGLYKRHGWKEVDRIQIDMTPHGGPGMATEVCLIREPGGGPA